MSWRSLALRENGRGENDDLFHESSDEKNAALSRMTRMNNQRKRQRWSPGLQGK